MTRTRVSPAGGSGRTPSAPAGPSPLRAVCANRPHRQILTPRWRRCAGGSCRCAARLRAPGAEARSTLNAALGELGSTIAMVGKLKSGLRAGEAERPGGADAERRLLRAVFQVVPAPIFLLERDGAVRRVNRQAAATVLGVQPGPATGKPFTAFAAPQDRRAVRTQLTAILRTGRSRLLRCRLAGTTGKVETITFHNSVIRKGAATDGVLHRRTRGACHDH